VKPCGGEVPSRAYREKDGEKKVME